MAPKELNFITGNANKLAEVKAILADSGVELRSQSVDLVEIQGTVEEVTKDKCRRAAEHVRAISAFAKRKQWRTREQLSGYPTIFEWCR